jgi:hypothetical protein
MSRAECDIQKNFTSLEKRTNCRPSRCIVDFEPWRIVSGKCFRDDLRPAVRAPAGKATVGLTKIIIMNTRLYVGNLPYTATENELRDLFAQQGPVSEVNLMVDKVTGRPRGFAFVTMAAKEGCEAAIKNLHGKDMGGRALTVNEARPREERSGGYGGGGGSRGPRRDYDNRR